MDDAAIGELIERVYDLALEPSLWPDLLARLTTAFGAHAASLEQEALDEAGGGGAVAIGVDPAAPQRYFDYYASRNVLRRVAHLHERLALGFIPAITTDEESLPKAELARSEFYADFLRPTGIHSVMTLGLWSEGMTFAGLDFYRPRSAPSFDQAEVRLAEALHPHLIRAFRLSRRLAGARGLAAGLAAGLDRSTYAVFVLGADGRVRHANAAAERLIGQAGGIFVAGGRLTAANVADAERLRLLVGRAGPGGEGGSISVRRPGRAALAVVAAPFGAERLSLLHPEPGVIVCVGDPDQAARVSEPALMAAFELTPAEARVASALLEGRSPRETAEQLGVSYFTVRTQLARIFEKTGATRQAELVALMVRTVAAGP